MVWEEGPGRREKGGWSETIQPTARAVFLFLCSPTFPPSLAALRKRGKGSENSNRLSRADPTTRAKCKSSAARRKPPLTPTSLDRLKIDQPLV